MPLPLHELCDLLPDISGKEFKDMVESIRDHGLDEPIVVYGGMVIDGKNRQRACVEAGVEPSYSEWFPPPTCVKDEDVSREIADFVVRRNLFRRHLSASQRSVIAADIAARMNCVASTLAKQFDVSKRMMNFATKVVKSGTKEIVDAVRGGVISASDASKVSGLSQSKQNLALSRVVSGESKTVAEASDRSKSAEPVYDTYDAIESMSQAILASPEFNIDEDGDVGGIDFLDEPVSVSSGGDCDFSISDQASWRSCFSSISRMSDKWALFPEQRKTKMKSERVHYEFRSLLEQLQAKWSEMNPGGRWS